MKTTNKPTKLTRAQIVEGLDTVPVSHILGKGASRELTGKQKRFAMEVAKGSSGAAAYRTAYNTKAAPKIQGSEASKLKANPTIAQEIQAYEAALLSETDRTPAALRALVVQTLAGVLLDPEAKQAVKVQAAKAIGAMTDVSLFTHRTETKVITSSEDARAAIMQQLRQLTNAQAVDVEAVDAGADSLLAELAIAGEDATHPLPTPQTVDEELAPNTHTIPRQRSQSELDSYDLDPENPDDDTPPPSTQETPPSSFET
jgi:hypothetical protein